MEQLKRMLEKEAGIYNHRLTDAEFIAILDEIEKIPLSERSKSKWQGVIHKITGCIFHMNEGLDYSDLNILHQQILAILKK